MATRTQTPKKAALSTEFEAQLKDAQRQVLGIVAEKNKTEADYRYRLGRIIAPFAKRPQKERYRAAWQPWFEHTIGRKWKTLLKWADTATVLEPAEFEKLVSLSNKETHVGLRWAHIMILTDTADRAARLALAREAVREGWSTRRLAREQQGEAEDRAKDHAPRGQPPAHVRAISAVMSIATTWSQAADRLLEEHAVALSTAELTAGDLAALREAIVAIDAARAKLASKLGQIVDAASTISLEGAP
ncbi:MAG: hypothetical protein HYV09_29240 [Deltaproteobacteria bacterium]|nr:hypothetical protein [Deltaproteobacteria bacterium]